MSLHTIRWRSPEGSYKSNNSAYSRYTSAQIRVARVPVVCANEQIVPDIATTTKAKSEELATTPTVVTEKRSGGPQWYSYCCQSPVTHVEAASTVCRFI